MDDPGAAQSPPRRRLPSTWALVTRPTVLWALAIPLAGAALVHLVLVLTMSPSVLIVNGAWTGRDLGGAAQTLAASLAVCSIWSLGSGVALTAATAAMLPSAPRLRDALRAGLWSRGAMLIATVVVAVTTFALPFLVAVVMLGAAYEQPVLAVASAVLLVAVAAGVIWFAPAFVAWPAWIDGHPAPLALARDRMRHRGSHDPESSSSGTGLRGVWHAPLVALLATVIGATATRWLVLRAPLPPDLAAQAAVPGIIIALTTLLAILVGLGLTSALVRAAATEVPPVLRSSPQQQRQGRPVRRLLAAGAAAILVVGALASGPVTETINPRGLTSVAAFEGPSLEAQVSVAMTADGPLIVSSAPADGLTIAQCDGAGCTSTAAEGYPMAVTAMPDNGVAVAGWGPIDGADGTDYELVVDTTSAAALMSADAPFANGTSIATVPLGLQGIVTPDDQTRLGVDIAFGPDAPVVAGVIRLDDPTLDSTPGNAGMIVGFCDDDACTDAATVEVPVEFGGFVGAPRLLDLTVAADGTALITLSSLWSTSPLQFVTVTPDGGFSVEVLDLAEADGGNQSDGVDVGAGAVVQVGSDGMPVILARARGNDAMTLVFCADVQCRSATATSIDQIGPIPQTPAMVIDDTGRPLIALWDAAAHSLIMLSCLDDRCTSTASWTVHQDPPAPSPTLGPWWIGVDLSLAPNGVVAATVWHGDRFIVQCGDARCGLD